MRYRLIDAEGEAARFRVVAANGAECEEIAVGNNICFAADCYRAVRDGKVTPCTLGEVVGDLLEESVIFKKTLYK